MKHNALELRAFALRPDVLEAQNKITDLLQAEGFTPNEGSKIVALYLGSTYAKNSTSPAEHGLIELCAMGAAVQLAELCLADGPDGDNDALLARLRKMAPNAPELMTQEVVAKANALFDRVRKPNTNL